MQSQPPDSPPPPPPPPYPPPPQPPPPPVTKPPLFPCPPLCGCPRHSDLDQIFVLDGYHFAEGTISFSSSIPPRFPRSIVVASSEDADHRASLYRGSGSHRPPLHRGALDAMLEAANKRKVGVIADATEPREIDPRTLDLLWTISDYDVSFDAIMERTRASTGFGYGKVNRAGRLKRPPPPPAVPSGRGGDRGFVVSTVPLKGNRVRWSRNAEHRSTVVTLPGRAPEGVDHVGDRPPAAASILEAVVGTLDEKAETVYVEAEQEEVEVINGEVKRYVGRWKKLMGKIKGMEREATPVGEGSGSR